MKRSLNLLALLFAVSSTACLPPPKKPNSEKSGAVESGNVGGVPGEGGTKPPVTSTPGTTDPGGKDPISEPGTSDPMGSNGPKGPALQSSLRFDEVVWLTSHNAFVNPEDAKWSPKNQSRSLQYQLDNGVTAFMLDVHSFEGDVFMCHGSCDGKPDLPFRIPGVHEKMQLLPYLKTINAYLNKHPDAFLTISLEDRVKGPEKEKLYKYFRDSGLDKKIFNPYAWDVTNKGWPRLDALKKDGKRLFVLSDSRDRKDFGIAFVEDFTAENYWSLGKSETAGLDYNCKPRWGGDVGKLNRIHKNFQYLVVMNHFRDIPDSNLSRKDNTWDRLWKRINENCLKEYQRRPNFLAVDHFDEADWGARKVVEELRLNGITVYKDKGLIGPMRMLKEGKYKAKDFSIGDNELESIKVNAGYRIKIYEDDDFKELIGEFTEDVRDLGDKANKASSIIVERK